MRTWLTNLFDDLRSGFWFLPSLVIGAAVVVALSMLWLDARMAERVALPAVLTSSAPAARTILSALAGALLTGTSVVFSITMLVLAQTASQYGSRLLRTVADGNVAQVTFGLFLGTSVYCLLVLRTVGQDGGDDFVPHLSVTVGVLGGLVSLFALIYFLHDTASSIQARTVVRSVHADLADAVDRLFPEPLGEADDADREPAADEAPPAEAVRLRDVGLGYLQAVDGESLLTATVERDLVVHLLVAPGAFVTPHTEVAAVVGDGEIDDETLALLRRCFLLGDRRTPRQDVVCAVDELVEVAVRALSPGVNDPFTAITCIDYLGAGLARLATRAAPDHRRLDESGTVRVVAKRVAFPEVLEAAVEPLVRHATGSPSVLQRVAETLAVVAASTDHAEYTTAVHEQADWLVDLSRRHLDDARAVERVESALESITKPS